MIVFDFITPEEIDELSDSDPRAAFTTFVRIALRRLGERSAKLDTSDQSDWETLNEARHGFMNVVIAAAKKYEIQPFASLEVPRLDNFGSSDHRQFRADLDHYLTQLVLDNSSRAKRDSIAISADLKTSIRTYVFHLRELIERAPDLEESKRQSMLRRLSDFEAELEKKRLSLMAVAVLAITLIGAPGAVLETGDAMNKLMTNILRIVGEAKLADDAARQLPPTEPPMALSAPRSAPAQKNMDDEIPF